MSTHPSISISRFTQLAQRLRHTNARYTHIAHQCRRTQRPTYHAKRRAFWAGLSIDTSKACTQTWPDQMSTTTPESTCRLSDRTAGGLSWGQGIGAGAEDACTPSLAREQPLTLCRSLLSPLWLDCVSSGFGSRLRETNGDDLAANAVRNLPCALRDRVPGAPRWRSIPLPEDTDGTDWDAPVVFATQPSLVWTYGDPDVWGYISTTDVSDSVSTSARYTGLGITASASSCEGSRSVAPPNTERDVSTTWHETRTTPAHFARADDGYRVPAYAS